MINARRPNPRLSLDDLVDALIENPSYDDTQLIGDVRADNARSSKMVKGQAEFLELNAWIDNHNELPSFDSSDFKENQLARRMNGYALNSAEHEDLKPFDKHGLINASLYQEIAAKPDLLSDADDFAAPFEFSSSNSDDISADYGASNSEVVAGTPDFDILDNHETTITAATKESSFIDDISAEDVAWLDSIEVDSPQSQEVIDAQTQALLSGIDELPRFDVTEPLSSISRPAISEAAAAIIKLRASRKLLEAKAQVDADINSALLMDDFDYQPPVAPLDTRSVDVFGSTTNTATQAQAQAQPQSQNQFVFDAETNVLDLKEGLGEPESSHTASIDNIEYPLIYMPAFFGTKEESSHTPEPVELEPAHEVEVTVESVVVGVHEFAPAPEPVKAVKEVQRIINPSYINILYQSTPDAKSYDDITYVRKHTPYVFDETPADDIDELQMAFSDIPLVDQLPANYHENLIDYYSITGISEDDLSLDDNNTLDTALPAAATTEESVAMVAATANVNANVDPEPAVGVIEVPSTPAISNEATVNDTTNTAKPKVDVYWSIDGEYDHSIVNSDYATGITQRHNTNPPMANAIPAPRKRIGLNNGVGVRLGTGTSSNTSPALVSDSTSSTSDNKVLAAADRSTTSSFSSDTDLAGTPAAINLSVAVVSQPLESATSEFASLDDILADNDDFLSSLCLEEEHLFDIENKYTDPSDKAKPDEVGKQTRCDDFFMYESHFNTLHAKLESGHLKTARYTATNLQVGDAFILNGVLGFVQSIGEYRENFAGVYDPRLRLIFDNGTESNILLQSLSRSLYVDKAGRLVIRSADDFTDFDSPDDRKPTKVRTGQVYIVRSLSDNPTLKQVSDLYKIGFTKGSVEERTKNAVRDTAFLEAPIEVVATATCYDLDPRGLEGLIHKFLECQRINITLTSKKGGLYHPQEWFDIELSEAKKIISHIVDGTIINYRMDNTTNRLVAK